MRHRKRGRRLGRSSSHRKAMLKNLASALFLTERDPDEFDSNAPKVQGRIVTTLQKAKEVRPLVERCVTIARHSLQHADEAAQYESSAERNSDEWKSWRKSDEWRKWAEARGPVVAARRRALRLLGSRDAVAILFSEIAPRFSERDGGYTRIMRLAQPRLGDAGTRAILEFVGKHDRVIKRSEKPAFAAPDAPDEKATSDAAETAGAEEAAATATEEVSDDAEA